MGKGQTGEGECPSDTRDGRPYSAACDRYRHALRRNLFELRYALSERNAINSLAACVPTSGWTFLTYVYISLSNDMFAHSMKVLDTHPDSVSFWFLYRCHKEQLDVELAQAGLDLAEIRRLTASLKHVRDKTHFHIDRNAVFDPTVVWQDANITGDAFNRTVGGLWTALGTLYRQEHGTAFGQPLYGAEDIPAIVSALREKGISL